MVRPLLIKSPRGGKGRRRGVESTGPEVRISEVGRPSASARGSYPFRRDGAPQSLPGSSSDSSLLHEASSRDDEVGTTNRDNLGPGA